MNKKISVCVSSYNRPDTLKQLIQSFMNQDYPNKELVVTDDSSNDLVRKLIKQYKSNTIKYFHNLPALGFSRNYLHSLEKATGDYIVTLGDDDIFMSEDALTQYVQIFNSHPDVGFIYSNMVQFSEKLLTEAEINFLKKSQKFKKGKESMENIWVRSIFIGGIGIRNNSDIRRFYPKKKILHPQVELIGHIINNYDSYLIAKTNIGFRSHDDQIIFKALKNKEIRKDGSHMTVELFKIFKDLKGKYGLPMSFDFAAEELVNQQIIMMFKERSNLGVEEMENNYQSFCKLSTVAKKSSKLKVAFFVAKYTPPIIAHLMRTYLIYTIQILNRKKYTDYNNKLLSMVNS